MSTPNRPQSARETIMQCSPSAQIQFLQITSSLLRDLLESERARIKTAKQELALLYDGRLRIHNRENRSHFGLIDSDRFTREKGIDNQRGLIHDLARRAYLEETIGLLELRLRRLERLLGCADDMRREHRLRTKLSRFADAGIDLTRVFFTREQNDWIDEPCSPNPFYQEDVTVPTRNGFLMRSKSEAAIASALESIGLPYRPDDHVQIAWENGSGKPFRNDWFADFKVPNLLGGITVHEHLGAFYLGNYGDNALRRLNDYHNGKIYELPGRAVRPEEFTWSFESDLRNKPLLERLVRRILLPGVPFL